MWIGWAYCWARHRETKRRKTSPTTIPRTLPFGLVRATIRPRPMAWATVAGIPAWASLRATRMRLEVAVSSSNRMRRVSAVRPDGPGAAPLRAFRRFMRSSGRSTGWSGWNSLSDGCRGVWCVGASCWILKFLQCVGCSGRQGPCCQGLSCGGEFAEMNELAGSAGLMFWGGSGGAGGGGGSSLVMCRAE